MTETVSPRVFQSTSQRGLDANLVPMRLWQKSKQVGIWDPQALDFSRDTEDWQRANDLENEVILHLTSLFQAGEESVVLDLLPLIQVIAAEGRLEEEMYLTAFLWEEAKHFEQYETLPFGLELETFTSFAMSQFQRRYARIEKARGKDMKEILYGSVVEA